MHKESSFERRGRGPRPPFRRKNRHPGLAERDAPQKTPQPKGEIPAVFAENVFGLVNPLLQHAVAEEGYAQPTPIQQQSIPPLLEGKDLLGCAQTGTGKTAAFLLPILHRLVANPVTVKPMHPRALVLAPTRELAAQIATSAATYGKYAGLPFAVVFGGVSQFPQVTALRRSAVLVIATPGRLLDLMEQGHVALDAIEEFVLDEADRMLDMGFMPDIKRILSKLPDARHTQFFSATLSPEILKLAKTMVKDPVQVTISPDQPTVDKINQKLMFVDRPNKDALLIHFLTEHPEAEKVIIFARTRHGADRIERKLEQADIRAEAIHSDKSQRARTDALNAFRSGRVRVLVATDIASRGIDVDGITHVVNFDLPEETESYVHRIGRTARAGASGIALSFVSAEERGLLRAVERMIKKAIEVDNTHPFHSEKAEQAAGRGGDAPGRPAWAEKKGHSRSGRREDGGRPHRPGGQGRRQSDFRRPSEAREQEGSAFPSSRPPRSEVRRERGPDERPPRSEVRRERERDERPPRQERDERGGGSWYKPFLKKHVGASERGPREEGGRDGAGRSAAPRGRDDERPPRLDEVSGDRPKRPFHKGGKPHSGARPDFGNSGGGFPRKGKGGGFKPGRPSRPPWKG